MIQLNGDPSADDSLWDVDGDGYVTTYDTAILSQFLDAGSLHARLNGSRPSTRYYYDDAGNLRFVVDPTQSATEYQYDARNRLVATVGERDSGPRTVPNIAMERQIDPQLRSSYPVTEYGYDNADRLEWIKDPLGYDTNYAYDGLDRITTVTLPPPNTGARPTLDYDYDLIGNLRFFTDGRQQTTEYGYDQLHRRTTVIQPEVPDGWYAPGATPEMEHPRTSYTYDVAGQLEFMTDPLQRKTEYRYDQLGRTTLVIEPHPVSGLPVNGVSNPQNDSPFTLYEYDLVGNPTRKQDAVDVAEGRFEETIYDNLNRIIEVRAPVDAGRARLHHQI